MIRMLIWDLASVYLIAQIEAQGHVILVLSMCWRRQGHDAYSTAFITALLVEIFRSALDTMLSLKRYISRKCGVEWKAEKQRLLMQRISLHTFFTCVCLWIFSITCKATIRFLDLSTTLLSVFATYNMFTHPDEFNYIFSEEITEGVAPAARGQR